MEIDESLNAERQVGTWQSLPEISPENCDFTNEQTENPNVELGTHTSNATSPDSECWVRRRYCLAGITKLGERVAKNTKLE
jgi:hypothetical protein